ncbi:hypothetical protein VTJ04DRAFT_1619 [Mycothermus thermophilus]|uniref:uncharacterized protein n=1 Tax=Humicola insolens TaxID=85995 RepID=UPI0037434200
MADNANNDSCRRRTRSSTHQPAQKVRVVEGNNSQRVAVKMEQSDAPVNPESESESEASVVEISGDAPQQLSKEEWISILYRKYYIYEVIYQAPDGDLTLVITGGSIKTPKIWRSDIRRALIVSTKKLNEALPNWRRHTTYITINDEFPIMELLPGTPLVFKWLIMAAHHPRTEHSGGYWIGQSLELAEIRELAKLSYQHNALHLIATSARQWIEALYPPGWKLQNPEEYSDQLDYLWLSYELGVEKLFHDICFNLAYVCKVEFWNPASMPPGIFDEIYRCRRDFVSSFLSEIYEYKAKLLHAVERGTDVDRSICANSAGKKKPKDCAKSQLKLLEDWMKAQKLGPTLYDKHGRLPTDRSPINFFSQRESVNLLEFDHYFDGQECFCGLAILAKKLKLPGKERLLDWMTENGGKARMATEEHIAYMREQRRKLGM